MRVLSGIQPSGRLHLGNYFGMMKEAINFQNKEGLESYYFIADYHSLTSTYDPEILKNNIRNIAIDFISCGLDPKKVTFWKQSCVPEVTELSWILSCVTPMGLLERCVSYKDKIAQGILTSHGLFSYPVLQSADILLYDSNLVPVGKDQKQHIEVTRDIAFKFNERYGKDLLTIPDVSIREGTSYISGIDGRKMSKSYDNAIYIFEDSEKSLKSKIMKIVTDSTSVDDPKDPDNSYILDIYKLFSSNQEYLEIRESFLNGGTGYGHYKKQLFEKIWEYFLPMRKIHEELSRDYAYVDKILKEGSIKAREKASEVIKRVREAVGI